MPAILFDLDGVLWSSINAHRLAFQRTLREAGYRWPLSQRAFSRLAGMTTEKALRTLFEEKNIQVTPAQFNRLAKRKRILALRYLMKTPLVRDLNATLKRLRKGARLAIVSSAHPKTVDLFLKRTRTRKYFDLVLSNRDVPHSKPSPRVYREALRRMGVKPRDAVAIEDTPHGIESAHRNRIPVIGMRGTTAPRLLRRAGAYKTISRLSELK